MPLVAITPENIAPLLPSILEIERASFLSPWSGDAFLQEVRNPASQIWGIIEDESLAGYICFWIIDREIHLLNVAVHPEKRGRGLARQLLMEMVQAGLSQGTEQIWLEVRPSNHRAKQLYEKLGFETVGRRVRYYRDTNEDAILMSLYLTAGQACC
jgi:ribosomal-protein-alanine N-acetyltransferase